MASDGSVVFSTELDTSGLRNSLDNLGSSIGKWTKSAGATIAKVGTGMLAGVSAGLGALAKQAFDYNSQMEDYQTNFSVLLGDEAEALEYVAYLREKAAKTPFGMEDLASASQTMLSFGLSAGNSAKALDQLGDIALGDKTKFQSLSLAFSQVSAAGKLSGQDLLQMVNAGFNPLNTIAEKTGTNLGDLKEVMAGSKGSDAFQKQMKAAQKEVEKLGDQASEGAKLLAQIGQDGYISAEMVGKAMEIETAPGGRFYNGMQKASETMSGMISTLKDDASALVGEVFAPMTEQMGKTVIPTAQGYVQKLSEAFKTGGTTGLIDTLGDVMSDALSKGVSAMPNMLEMAKKLLTSLGKALKKNAKTMAKNLAEVLTSAVESLAAMTPTMLSAALSIGTALMSALAEKLPELVPSVVDGFLSVFVTLCENADDILLAGVAIAGGLITGIVRALPNLFSGVTEAFIALFTNTDEIAAKAEEIFDEKFGSTLTAYENFQNGIKDADDLFKESVGEAKNREETALALLDKYVELGDKATQSEADMEQMKILANEIVALFPQLAGVVFDSTGTFNDNADAIRNQIYALTDLDILAAYNDLISSQTRALAEMQVALNRASTEITDTQKTFDAADKAAKSAQALQDALFEEHPTYPALLQHLETMKELFEGTPFEERFTSLWNAIESAAKGERYVEFDTLWPSLSGLLNELQYAKEEEAKVHQLALDTMKPQLEAMQSDYDKAYKNLEIDIGSMNDLQEKVKSTMAQPPEGTPVTDAIETDTEASQTAQTEQAASVKEGAKATGTAYTEGISEGIDENKGAMETSAKGAVDSANKAAMTQTNQSSTVGYQMAAGVAAGVRMGAPLLYNAINGMMQRAYVGARKFAQIASPSRLFANGIGAFLPSGAAMGVESNAWKLRKAVDDMIAGSMPQEGIELGLNVHPGYTPGRTVAAQIATSQGLSVGAAQTIAYAVREGLRDMGVVMNGQRVGDIVTSTVSRNIEDMAWAGRFE